MNVGIVGLNGSISRTVMTLGLVLIQRLAYRLPCAGPVILRIVIADINISARQTDVGIETVTDNSSVSAAFYKAVSSAVV